MIHAQPGRYRRWFAIPWRTLVTTLVSWVLATGAEGISFRNDVMAVLSKAGCNSGPCHGNANGKGGFKLSLRGEDPDFDFDALTRDQFGRRINLFDPGQSLILLKPSTDLAHEGGRRLAPDSPEYDTLRRWITAGAVLDPPDLPRLESLEVNPDEHYLISPEETIALRATARFSDGSERDVTRQAVYELSHPIAQVSPDGRVTRQSDGETTVLVRYLDRQMPVRLAFVPARPEFRWSGPPPAGFIDEHVFSKLARLRMHPSPLCRDEVFLRRAHLDLTGLLPTAAEARDFVADQDPRKRARLVDQLLERAEFADFWALKWADLLRVEERTLDQKGMQGFHRWIREGIATNKPLDRFVRELVAARGSTYLNPPANFHRALRDPITRAETVAQVFLGTRLQCAQCHNHPFDRWTQDDYYRWAALFARVQYKVLQNLRRDENDSHEFKGEQIVFVARRGELRNPRTGKPAPPAVLAAMTSGPADNLPPGDDLEVLAQWITAPENPFFARAQVNRVWFHLLGRGLVEPIDDFRATNPPSHPALLDALALDFIRHGFDLRHLIRTIMNSTVYQLASEPNATNQDDESNFARTLPRRLAAEQLLDCQHQVIGVPSDFPGYPPGTRAAQLPGAQSMRRRGDRAGDLDQFLATFGKPVRLLACECERSTGTTMSQAFQMISGPTLHDLLTRPGNRIGALIDAGMSDAQIVAELCWATLSRSPTAAENEAAAARLRQSASRRDGLEDILWGFLNAKEFLLRP